MARAKTSKSYQVFISHATADKWIAVAMCKRLERAGIKTFRDDRDIDGGDDIPEQLRMEIKKSRELVVLLTPTSAQREWVRIEVATAWATRKGYIITPVLCHVEADSIPNMLRSKKAVSLNEFDTLVNSIIKRKGIYDAKQKPNL